MPGNCRNLQTADRDHHEERLGGSRFGFISGDGQTEVGVGEHFVDHARCRIKPRDGAPHEHTGREITSH